MSCFEVGDTVVVREDAPGYQLWYKGKTGVIVAETTNDDGDPRLLVTFQGEGVQLPFGDWELIRVNKHQGVAQSG